jgi:predicted PurR-regulated permease PerM
MPPDFFMSDEVTTQAGATRSFDMAAWVLMGLALFCVIHLRLIAVLMAGLLVFQLVHMLAGVVRVPRMNNRGAKLLIVAALAAVVVAVVTLTILGIGVFLRHGPDNLSGMLTQIAVVLDELRDMLPPALAASLPDDADNIRQYLVAWLHAHAADIRTLGTHTIRSLVHVLIGLILGAMVALHEVTPRARPSLFLQALTRRVVRLAEAFRRIILAQVPISAINTCLTAIYLIIVLPCFGIDLPFKKTLVAVTFLAGLLPVVGNLISNTAIFLVSLRISFAVAAVSLGYLIVIHKLEYFLNAKIVGTRINAKAWELLIAMLVFEAAFGLGGLIMAPLVYAYVKYELMEEGVL